MKLKLELLNNKNKKNNKNTFIQTSNFHEWNKFSILILLFLIGLL